jgi:RES domain-containing protein
VNQPPAAVDDGADLAEDDATIVAVLDNDSDPEGDPLTISAVGAAQHGSVAIDGAAIRYTPAANYNGVDAFTYTIADGQGNTRAGHRCRQRLPR